MSEAPYSQMEKWNVLVVPSDRPDEHGWWTTILARDEQEARSYTPPTLVRFHVADARKDAGEFNTPVGRPGILSRLRTRIFGR